MLQLLSSQNKGDRREREVAVYQVPSILGQEAEGQQEQETKKKWAECEQDSGGPGAQSQPSSDGTPNKKHFDKYTNLVNLANLVIQQIETLMNLPFGKFLFIYEWVSVTQVQENPKPMSHGENNKNKESNLWNGD